MPRKALRASLLLSIAAFLLAARAFAAAPVAQPAGAVQGMMEPGPPFPNLPSYGAIVHLHANSCSQVASVTLKSTAEGGRGLVVVDDRGNAPSSIRWSTSAEPWMPQGSIYPGFWVKLDFPAAASYTLTFASSDCVVVSSPPMLFNPAATTVSVTVK